MDLARRGAALARHEPLRADWPAPAARTRSSTARATSQQAFGAAKRMADIAPHGYNGHLSTFQEPNLCASLSNVRIVESDPDAVPCRDKLFTVLPEIRDGHMAIPTGPGWGTALNEAAARRRAWTG